MYLYTSWQITTFTIYMYVCIYMYIYVYASINLSIYVYILYKITINGNSKNKKHIQQYNLFSSKHKIRKLKKTALNRKCYLRL